MFGDIQAGLVDAAKEHGDRMKEGLKEGLKEGMVQAAKEHGDRMKEGMVQAADRMKEGMVQAADRMKEAIMFFSVALVVAMNLKYLQECFICFSVAMTLHLAYVVYHMFRQVRAELIYG